MIVKTGRKRSLRCLEGVEVEIIAQKEDNSIVTCRRVDDGKIVKLSRALLKPKAEVEEGRREERQKWLAHFRTEILDLEDLIPWNSVTKSWKQKRGSWRKRILASITLQDIGEALKEFLRCLVLEKDSRVGHSILKWEDEIDEMCRDVDACDRCMKMWRRLSGEIQKWIRDLGSEANMDSSLSKKRAQWAFNKIKEEIAKGSSMNQFPLEAVLGHDVKALNHLKNMIIAERKPSNLTQPMHQTEINYDRSVNEKKNEML